MFASRSLGSLVFSILGALTLPNSASAQSLRLPSETLHDIARTRLEHFNWTPTQVEAALKPLFDSTRTTDLSADEEVALGLAYFFTFDGPKARPLLEKNMTRDDRLGRVSWQALQQMSFLGAKDYALVERRLAEFRRKYRPSIEDPEYTYRMVDNLARQAATTGNHARAVELILEDVRALPIDMPARSFELLGAHLASFRAAGQTSVAFDLMKRHRDTLRAIESSLPAIPSQTGTSATALPTAGIAIVHRPGVIHADPFNDLLFTDDPKWTPEGTLRGRRQRVLANLDQWLAPPNGSPPL
jgi:hypothetical protein